MHKKKYIKGMSATHLAICSLFTALTAVGAYIKIPIPIIPFTMQTFFVTLSGLMLGSKYGLISMVMYMLIGLVGIPIFTMGGGISYIFKPTFGYIIGFCVGVYITGMIREKTSEKNFRNLLVASFAGLLAIYITGIIYFYIISNFVIGNNVAIKTLVINCFLITIGGDFLSCVLATVVARRTIPVLKRHNWIK